jgi:hypothetical protein
MSAHPEQLIFHSLLVCCNARFHSAVARDTKSDGVVEMGRPAVLCPNLIVLYIRKERPSVAIRHTSVSIHHMDTNVPNNNTGTPNVQLSDIFSKIPSGEMVFSCVSIVVVGRNGLSEGLFTG